MVSGSRWALYFSSSYITALFSPMENTADVDSRKFMLSVEIARRFLL